MEIYEVRFRPNKNANIGVQLCTNEADAIDFAESLPPVFCEIWMGILEARDGYFRFKRGTMRVLRDEPAVSL